MATNWKLIILLSLAIGFGGFTSSFANREISKNNSADYFMLFSWKASNNGYIFALIAKGNEQEFLRKFKSRRDGIRGSLNLKMALQSLPVHSLVIWEDAPQLGIVLPSAHYIDGIVAFANSKNIRIQLNPILSE